jgi:hypothetical protein
MIEISDKTFITTFEDFERIIVPLENKLRYEKGLDPLTEDEKANLFLELREQHGIARKDTE